MLTKQIDSDGALRSNQQFEICEEAGYLLATVPFKDAAALRFSHCRFV